LVLFERNFYFVRTFLWILLLSFRCCDSCSYSGSWKIWWSSFQCRLLWDVVEKFLSSLFYLLLCCLYLLQWVCCTWGSGLICLRWFQYFSFLYFLLEWNVSICLNYLSPWSMLHIANVYLLIPKIVWLQPWDCKHHWW